MTQAAPNLRSLLGKLNACSPELIREIARNDQLKLQLRELAVVQRIRLGFRSGHIMGPSSSDCSRVIVHWSDGSETDELLSKLQIQR